MQIYRCPNNCHVADRQMRCPKCDKWLLTDGRGDAETVMEEARKKTIEIHKSYFGTEPKYRKFTKRNK